MSGAGREESEIEQTTANVHPAAQVVYIGSVGGMEQQIVERESTLPYRALPAAAIRGRGPVALARNSLTLATGTLSALALLRELRIVAILGTGGYVCVPLFLAARIHRIPTLLYLPDVIPGLAVRMLSHIATQVACSVEHSRAYFAPSVVKKVSVTGYPVRSALFGLDQAACRAAFALHDHMPVLIVYGGSRGARSINRAIEALLADILAITQVIHICGREGDETWLRATAEGLDERLQSRYRLYPYLESGGTAQKADRGGGARTKTMVMALGAADLALCRSGASILGELPALGLPAILVPYPYVHQDDNADYLVHNDAAVKISDAAMLGNGRPQEGPLFTQVRRLLQTHVHERLQMAERSRSLARPHATHGLAEQLRSLSTRRYN